MSRYRLTYLWTPSLFGRDDSAARTTDCDGITDVESRLDGMATSAQTLERTVDVLVEHRTNSRAEWLVIDPPGKPRRARTWADADERVQRAHEALEAAQAELDAAIDEKIALSRKG